MIITDSQMIVIHGSFFYKRLFSSFFPFILIFNCVFFKDFHRSSHFKSIFNSIFQRIVFIFAPIQACQKIVQAFQANTWHCHRKFLKKWTIIIPLPPRTFILSYYKKYQSTFLKNWNTFLLLSLYQLNK